MAINYLTSNQLYYGVGTPTTAGVATTTTITTPSTHGYITQVTTGYTLPMARNALADHCALAVYEKRISLKRAAKEMPGDYDENRKLLGDVFLMSPIHLSLEQAASLAFVLREEVDAFLSICEQVGAIVPPRA
jgi:hypothetical protein